MCHKEKKYPVQTVGEMAQKMVLPIILVIFVEELVRQPLTKVFSHLLSLVKLVEVKVA